MRRYRIQKETDIMDVWFDSGSVIAVAKQIWFRMAMDMYLKVIALRMV